MDASSIISKIPSGIHPYSRLVTSLALGFLFLLLVATGRADLFTPLLKDPNLGYWLKVFCLSILAFFVGSTLVSLGRLLLVLLDSGLYRFKWYKESCILRDFYTPFITAAAQSLEPAATREATERLTAESVEMESDLIRSLVFYYSSKYSDLNDTEIRQSFYLDLHMGLLAACLLAVPFAGHWVRIGLVFVAIVNVVFAWIESNRQVELDGAVIAVGYLREKHEKSETHQ